MAASNSCLLLDLPREIRDQILGEVLFPGEKQPKDFKQNVRGTASTTVRQIHPYDTDRNKKPRFDIAVITTCRQIQREAEDILYGSSSWNLMYQDWWDNEKVSYEFFEKLPRRLRQLIQRVERKCYSSPYGATISLWDWKAFMTFLARECPNLHTLSLWGPGDTNEGPPWVATCSKDAEWVQAILQIKTLKHFDIPVIPGGIIYDYPEFKDEFLPWLKASLTKGPKTQSLDHQLRTPSASNTPFPFLRLPRSIRDRIYRHTLLPPSRRIHPYLNSWYDLTTRNAILLFLTNKQVHIEAELILYGAAIFTSPCLAKYDRRLSRFLGDKIRESGQPKGGLQPRLLGLINDVSFGWSKVGQLRVFSIIGNSMQLDHLEFVLPERGVEYINEEWRTRAANPRAMWRAGYTNDFTMQTYARIPNLTITTPPGHELEPECREWWTKGLRHELLNPSGDPKLAWLHNRKENMLTGSSSVAAMSAGSLRDDGVDEDDYGDTREEVDGDEIPFFAEDSDEEGGESLSN